MSEQQLNSLRKSLMKGSSQVVTVNLEEENTIVKESPTKMKVSPSDGDFGQQS